jgi:RNA polymerase sigma factor (TIGR02999 family)
MSEAMAPVTVWLSQAAEGDEHAAERVASWAYAELEQLAARRLRREFPSGDITLEPAALVNETFLKLLENPVVFANRRHFFAFVSKVMLRVLIDYRRARIADKRGGGDLKLTLGGVDPAEAADPVDVLALSQALEKLESLDPRKAEVTRLRMLWGMELAEIAQVLGVAEPTVRRDWRFARTWLAEELDPTS